MLRVKSINTFLFTEMPLLTVHWANVYTYPLDSIYIVSSTRAAYSPRLSKSHCSAQFNDHVLCSNHSFYNLQSFFKFNVIFNHTQHYLNTLLGRSSIVTHT